MLELRHLETLLALSECGSLSKAAERLYLTQSALSHQIKALERYYRTTLIEKNVRPVRFTATGRRLLDLAAEVLPRVSTALRDLARLAEGSGGRLRVAVQCHNCFDWLMPAMDAYRSLWPDVELDIVSGFLADPLPLVERGDAELAVIHDAPPDRPTLLFSPLFRYESVALLNPRHPLAAKPWLEAED
ncbi:MAG TPA: LysR family transcriptional regulator, partial [Steroidobacteraceae bacterium]|nr:LysR family transcriptional regulator [Steroidobacteraceae bacterium]